MIPVVWTDWENYKTWPNASALMVDTANDEVSEVIETDGCPGAIHPSVLSNGDRIFASDTWSLYLRWWDESDQYQHSCAVRVPESGTGLEGELLDLQVYTDGLPIGSLKVDKSDVAYGAAYYADVGDAEPDFDARMNASDAWKIWRMNLDSDEVGEEVEGIPGVGGNVFFVRLAGNLYVVVEEEDGVALYELRPAALPNARSRWWAIGPSTPPLSGTSWLALSRAVAA